MGPPANRPNGATMRAGRLAERVRFERRASTDDGFGNHEGAWETLVSAVAAEIRPVSGKEEVLAERLSGVTAFEIRVRASTDTLGVDVGDRAVNQRSGATFNIRSITNPDQRGRELLMTCTEGDADG